MTHNTVASKWWTRAGGQAGAGSGSRRGNRRGLRPELLGLEDRQLLATLMVTNTSASGAGSLAQAVATANGNNQANTIQFGPLFNTPQTINLSGQLELTDTAGPQTFAAPGAVATINGGNSTRDFQIDPGVTATISGLTIMGGSADQGGGVLSLPGTNVTLNNCTITGNAVKYINNSAFPGIGGGIANDATMVLNNCGIRSNTASSRGGGVYDRDGANLTMNGCTVSGNTSGGDGGGVYDASGSKATLTGTTVTGNTASGKGGGISNHSANLTLANSTVSNNTAGTFGGGINSYYGTVSVNNCTIAGNTAGGTNYGGGIYNYFATATLSNSTFVNDKAGGHGGGVYNQGPANITNCTFFNDTAGAGGNNYYGGGLYSGGTSRNPPTTNLVACTFSGNTASSGGGVYRYNGTMNIQDTIIAGNTASSGPDLYGTITSVGNNLIGNTSGSAGFSASNNDLLNVNPMLGGFGSYGGPTQTLPLTSNSPAVGKGVKTNYAGTATPLTVDQRGFGLDSPTPDIGAFQVPSGGPTGTMGLVVTDATDNLTTTPNGLTLRQAINVANALSRPATITFSFTTAQTITLAGTQLELNDTGGPVTITGPAAGLTINASGASRVLQVDGNVTLSMSGLAPHGGQLGPWCGRAHSGRLESDSEHEHGQRQHGDRRGGGRHSEQWHADAAQQHGDRQHGGRGGWVVE